MMRASRALLQKYDAVVVGGGPGGYVCAIKAAQLGLNVACVEKRGPLGGTCLNVGCIPSKSLLHTSHQFHEAKHGFSKSGIKVSGEITADVPTMMKQKDKTIRTLTKGIAGLFKNYGVTNIGGTATFKDANTIVVKDAKGQEQVLETDNIVFAMGSEVANLPGFPEGTIDEQDVVSSTGALAMKAVPETLTVIGGGVIGLELGCVWARLGAKVHVVEFLPKIMGPADAEISAEVQKILGKQGLTFDLSSKVVELEKTGKGVRLAWEGPDGKKESVSNKVLVSTGRVPNTKGLGLENLGIELDRLGRIPVDGFLNAGQPGLYGIGDCIEGPMLAHKAEEDGVYVAEQLADKIKNGKAQKDEPVSYHGVPSVVYTYPEVAWVGKSEEELTKEGVKFTKSSFPLMANSRARANDETAGFVKILSDDSTKQILGCHMIAPYAGDVLMPAVYAVQHQRPVSELSHTCFAHPTVSEALKEAAMKAACGNYIHNV